MLMDHTNPQVIGVFRGIDGDFLSIDKDLPLFRIIDPGDGIHQGRLAGSVFPQQGKDLSLVHFQGNIFIGCNIAKSFRDVFQF